MKTTRIARFVIILGLVAGMGCQKFDLKTDELDLALDLDIIKTACDFLCIDAQTSLPIGGTSSDFLKFKVSGSDSYAVVVKPTRCKPFMRADFSLMFPVNIPFLRTTWMEQSYRYTLWYHCPVSDRLPTWLLSWCPR